ncbi:hypothetical protein NC651_020403 [Populus alba x Populus x berolinensis]|nr:hypothetical protein NC651_020403 [Populus alba x Populus x berolinensis]
MFPREEKEIESSDPKWASGKCNEEPSINNDGSCSALESEECLIRRKEPSQTTPEAKAPLLVNKLCKLYSGKTKLGRATMSSQKAKNST